MIKKLSQNLINILGYNIIQSDEIEKIINDTNKLSGLDRLEIIKDCQFFDPKTKEKINIKKLGKMYSPQWEKSERNKVETNSRWRAFMR